jgi:hypothetical protein
VEKAGYLRAALATLTRVHPIPIEIDGAVLAERYWE